MNEDIMGDIKSKRSIYIDFDDCLCETARDFSGLIERMFGIDVPYEKIRHFDYAIEDSPAAFHFFSHLKELKVMVYDRPWNQDCAFPGENFCRCYDWETIRKLVV